MAAPTGARRMFAPSEFDRKNGSVSRELRRYISIVNPTLNLKGTNMNTRTMNGHTASIRYAIGESSLGDVLVAQSARGVVAILLGDDRTELEAELARRFAASDVTHADDAQVPGLAAVIALIENPQAGADLALDIRGTAFQKRVWKALCDIPCGTTRSYTDIARRIGAPRAVRAVAGACAANALAVAIPCHRVLRQDGALSGYRWGIARKRALLAREAVA